jgi:hypothetical protein
LKHFAAVALGMLDITIVVMCKVIVTRAKTDELDIFFSGQYLIAWCTFITQFRARRQNQRGDSPRPWLNTINGHRRRLLIDLDLCWLRAAQSLPYRAGARVAIAFLVDLQPIRDE